MNKSLNCIKQKIGIIQFGLLRYRDRDQQLSLQVKVAENEGALLSCIITDVLPGKKMLNRNVRLIQKYNDDYLYIAGKVMDEMEKNKKILSVHITKACWFVKKSRGSVSWLQ